MAGKKKQPKTQVKVAYSSTPVVRNIPPRESGREPKKLEPAGVGYFGVLSDSRMDYDLPIKGPTGEDLSEIAGSKRTLESESGAPAKVAEEPAKIAEVTTDMDDDDMDEGIVIQSSSSSSEIKKKNPANG